MSAASDLHRTNRAILPTMRPHQRDAAVDELLAEQIAYYRARAPECLQTGELLSVFIGIGGWASESEPPPR